MINISKYVYSSYVTENGFFPYVCKDENDKIYTVMVMNDGTDTWLDIYTSENEGDSWERDESFPANQETGELYSPKMFVKDDIVYVFAHGKVKSKNAIYLIRKFLNLRDEGGNPIDPFWEDEWTKLIYDSSKHCRITDLAVDKQGYYAYILYDKETSRHTYETRLNIFSLVDNEIKLDVSVNENPSIAQHNGKLAILDNKNVAVSWEMQTVSVYDSKTYQIAYRQFDMVSQEWTDTVILSEDSKHNNYHQSITKDSANNVYVAWLNTQETNEDGSVTYFKTNKIQCATVTNGEKSSYQTISEEAQENEYPYLVCDENDSLYILFNSKNYVQYFTKKINTEDWVEIKNISQNNWKLLVGFCYDNNLYTVVRKDNLIYMVRIDTALAEDFQPVSDFQIIDVDNKQISFSWTAVRNAEDIKLEELLADTSKWNWFKPNTTAGITLDTNKVYCVGLKANKLYAFKLTYKDAKNKNHTIFYPKRLITQHDADENYTFSWKVPSEATTQELYAAEELWQEVADIANDAYYYTLPFDNEATSFRLNITGGMAEGYSNEVSPLTIDLDGEDYLLSWSPFKDADFVEVQQSIDMMNYYPAKNENINPQASSYRIDNVNNVTYSYRLLYHTQNYNYSNIVSLTNNLKILDISYDQIAVQWTSTEQDEKTLFQWSTDEGNTWNTNSYMIENSMARVNQLEANTNYWLRLYFPNRFTGKYSNIIKFTTTKYPIKDFEVINYTKKDATMRFVVTKDYSDIELVFVDFVTNERDTVLLSSFETCTDNNFPDNNKNVLTEKEVNAREKEIELRLTGLKKGTTYLAQVQCLGSDWGNSNIANFQTYGDNPQKLKCVFTDKHSVKLTWDNLERITKDNVSDFVYVEYSTDGIKKEIVNVDTIEQPFVLKNLMQDTIYQIKLICGYGDNAGESEITVLKTEEDSFAPVYGARNNNELCMCRSGNIMYIFDKGKLYVYDMTTEEQELLVDYNVKANHVYGDIVVDKNGYIHLVFTYGKQVCYVTNCKERLNDGTIITHDLADVIIVENNNLVNEYLYPDLEMDMKTNILYMTWQESYGYYSNISLMEYCNGSPLLEESLTMINNGLHNNIPKIKLIPMGGFVISAIDSADRIQLLLATLDNDYTSPTFQEMMFETKTLELDNPYTDNYNNYDMWIDNLGDIRIFYDSVDADGNPCSTYSTLIDDKFETQTVFHDGMNDTSVYAYDELVLVAKSGENVFTSKYLTAHETFSDINNEEFTVNANRPLVTSADKENIYILNMEQGLFKVYMIEVEKIINNNNYVSSIWIDNYMSTMDEDLEVQLSTWTSGNPSEYPQFFIKVNNLIKEITPLDEFGGRKVQKVKFTDFSIVDLTDETNADILKGVTDKDTKLVVKLSYNKEMIVMDVTDMLYYTWDNIHMVNTSDYK